IHRLLQKDPAARPRSAAEVERELAQIDRHTAAPAPKKSARGAKKDKRRSLGGAERRLQSVIIIGRPKKAPPKKKGDDEVDTEPEAEDAGWAELGEKIRGAAKSFGGDLEFVAGGQALVSLSLPGAAPTDQAARASRCALALRAVAPRLPIAVTTGLSSFGDRRVVGDVVSRALALIARVE